MGYVENSVVGPGVYVEEHAVVRNSVLMDNVFIGERSVVQSCIVDEGVSVGPCCEIGAKDRFVLASNPIAILSAGAGFRSRRSLGESVENVREGIDDPLMSSPVADRLP